MIRDNNGKVLRALAQRLPKCDLILAIEAHAILEDIQLAHQQCTQPVPIEIDSQQVCRKTNSFITDYSPAGDFIQLIRSSIVERSNIVSLRHVNRKANNIAHSLAKMSAMSATHHLLFRTIPNQLIPILLSNIS